MSTQFVVPSGQHYSALYGVLKEFEAQMAVAQCIGQCQGCMCSCRCSCSGGMLNDCGWDD